MGIAGLTLAKQSNPRDSEVRCMCSVLRTTLCVIITDLYHGGFGNSMSDLSTCVGSWRLVRWKMALHGANLIYRLTAVIMLACTNPVSKQLTRTEYIN